ncbi:MAG: hypothetical protein IPL52_16100 [Flavobacteriales bacterium]|nr:hypothetical protein [Flavobacteriales bacterium]
MALLSSAYAQNVPCPGEALIFQLEGEYYGTKTWEHSTDGANWSAINVVENEPFVLQPEQSGWYRVRFHDEACSIDYFSEAQRFVAHAINLGDALTISIGGVVRNEWGMPVNDATVRAGCGGGVSTTTDRFGVFLLHGVVAYEGLAHVSVEKAGYFPGSRSFVPGANADATISHAHITLLSKEPAGTVTSASGGTVQLQGVTISFPPNAFVQNGQPFNGPVSVALNHIDPTSDDLHEQMPGMLMGVMDEQPQLLHSFGMVGVELTDAVGTQVQLAQGSTATVRFPVMAAQQADALGTIVLWWFDEDLGYWVEEGEAQLVGNEYVGQVAHFSWWNCDVPSNFVLLKGIVIDQATGMLLTGAQVLLVSANMGTGVTYTNDMGEFSGQVPIGQVLTLQVWLPCGPFGSFVLVHEEPVGPFAAEAVMMVMVSVPDVSFVTGTVLDCFGDPVEEGYVWCNGQVVFCAQGSYQLVTCADSVRIVGVDLVASRWSTVQIAAVEPDTTNVPDITACLDPIGSAVDIEGNVYQTVWIGNQEWMAENLRTGSYMNGEAIPNVSDAVAWTQQTIGAWAHVSNNSQLENVYGKLYNWYAVTDSRNVCPIGWHVPSDLEWLAAELTLGMLPSEAFIAGYRGEAQNVGGKMKSATAQEWIAPNAGATNESQFSGMPGGYRHGFDQAFFYSTGSVGAWWSRTPASSNLAQARMLVNINTGVSRVNRVRIDGLAVRCVRD